MSELRLVQQMNPKNHFWAVYISLTVDTGYVILKTPIEEYDVGTAETLTLIEAKHGVVLLPGHDFIFDEEYWVRQITELLLAWHATACANAEVADHTVKMSIATSGIMAQRMLKLEREAG